MINDIEKEKQKKPLINKYLKKYELELEKVKQLKKKEDSLEKERKKILEKISGEVDKDDMIYFNQYSWDSKKDKGFSVANKCWVPKEINELLTFSNKLWALGKRKEAQEIWNKIIKDYKLLQR